jgi:hypothetical protein
MVKSARTQLTARQLQQLLSRCDNYPGFTVEDFLELLQLQQGRCKICRQYLSGGRETHIDHDHETRQVRGLLCASCNSGLGFFKDSVLFLEEAIRYLDNAQRTRR